jgi:hypothetical protein
MRGKASKYFSIEKCCGELFSDFGARFYSHYTQKIFFQIGLSEVKKFQNDFHYSGPQKAHVVDTEFKIQVTQGVQNIQTRDGTPCITI